MNTDDQSTRYEKWQQLMEEQEKSGKTQKAFCSERGLPLSKFTYYRMLIKRGKRATLDSSPAITPIRIKKTESATSGEVKITLPNGFQCAFSSETDTFYVRQLMEVLLSC